VALPLLTVTDTFAMGNGWLIVAPEFEHTTAYGDVPVVLRRPDGSELVTTASVSRPFVNRHPYTPSGLVCRFGGLTKGDLPIGTQIWLADPALTIESWQREAGSLPIEWTGDLDDDCTAQWAGLTLRAEEMKRGRWWWAVYDDRTSTVLADSNGSPTRVSDGVKARKAATTFAMRWLGLHDTSANEA
jgi:hypothetical protein